MSNVINFPGITTLDEPAESVLEKAKAWGMDKCLVVGFDAKGDLVFGGSYSDAGEIMLLLEAAKQHIIKLAFGQ